MSNPKIPTAEAVDIPSNPSFPSIPSTLLESGIQLATVCSILDSIEYCIEDRLGISSKREEPIGNKEIQKNPVTLTEMAKEQNLAIKILKVRLDRLNSLLINKL